MKILASDNDKYNYSRKKLIHNSISILKDNNYVPALDDVGIIKNLNDLEILELYNYGVMTTHNKVLDKLNIKEYDALYEYIGELSN